MCDKIINCWILQLFWQATFKVVLHLSNICKKKCHLLTTPAILQYRHWNTVNFNPSDDETVSGCDHVSVVIIAFTSCWILICKSSIVWGYFIHHWVVSVFELTLSLSTQEQTVFCKKVKVMKNCPFDLSTKPWRFEVGVEVKLTHS
jgi:hypothetical protein